MKKVLLICICLFTLAGCGKAKIQYYELKDLNAFIDEIMKYETGEKSGVVYIDLRPLGTEEGREDGTFAKNHVKGFISYDIKKGNQEEMTTWLTGMYHKSTVIFLIDEAGNDVTTAANWLKEVGYKEIYAYKSGFTSIENNGQELLHFVSGIEDCGC